MKATLIFDVPDGMRENEVALFVRDATVAELRAELSLTLHGVLTELVSIDDTGSGEFLEQLSLVDDIINPQPKDI